MKEVTGDIDICLMLLITDGCMVAVLFCVKKKCTIAALAACYSSPWEKRLLMSGGVLSTGSQCYSEGLLAQNQWGTQDSCR